MRFNVGLSARVTLGVLLLVLAGGLLWIEKENDKLHAAYLSSRSADLESALHVEQVRLNQSIETLRQDVVFLANTPPISGIVRASANNGLDPRDKNTYATWEARLQDIFAAFLRAHPDYFQVRYIGAAGEGRELVRVENRDGRVEVAPREALQAKGDQDYFRAGLMLTVGRVYLSEFTLNREWGRIEEPSRPTLRAITPVFDASGRVFGMVVINKDARTLFKPLSTDLPPGVRGYVADQQGHYLLHPDAARAFAFEFGSQDKISDDFPSLKPMYESQTKQNELHFHEVTKGESGYLAAERVFFDASDPARFLLLAYHLPGQMLAQQESGIPLPWLLDTILITLLVGAALMLMLRHTFSPLKRITAAAHEISAGNRQFRLSETAGGEIGELSSALNTMLDKLSDGESIERENAFRKELIESLPGVFYMFDAQGRFLMWNRNLERVLQRSPEELASAQPLDFFEGADKTAIENTITRVFEAGDASTEAVLVAKDGTKTPYHFTGRRVMRDGAPVLIGLGLDISAQRESARVREALLQRNQALMQNSMEGIHVLDVDGNVLEVNDAFCRMLGYTREEALRLNVKDWNVQFSAEELRERLKSFMGNSGTFETVHKHKDGSLLDVEVCATGVEIDGKGYLYASSRDITERKKVQAVLQRQRKVIETAMDGFWMTDANGFLEEVNEAYAKISGYTMQELVGMHISHLEASEREEETRAHIELIMARGYDRFETKHRRKDGRVVDIEVAATYLQESGRLFVFCHNITQRKQNEQELRIAAATFDAQDAILITDAGNKIIRVNRAFTQITGYSAAEVLGRDPKLMSSGRHDKAFYDAMWQQILETGSWAGEIWDRRHDGEIYPKWMTITAIKDEHGATTQYVAIFSDITARKQEEEEIRSMAFYDALTQLPNRRLFLERFHEALAASARYGDHGALLFIDLDRFKILNDTLGHDYGDLMLIEVAARIKSCVREIDTVARLGGDEFVVLLENISGDDEIAAYKAGGVAEKIRESLSRPYRLREHEHASSPSIGISLYHGNGESMDTLLKYADMAMYRAKEAGRNKVCFYDHDMQQKWTSIIESISGEKQD
ncbi:MAG: PAS domain S-box protein [Sideroxyarcus sp.]|nr:PAS domain S-box protein [Sideroxyarcus sp.]